MRGTPEKEKAPTNGSVGFSERVGVELFRKHMKRIGNLLVMEQGHLGHPGIALPSAGKVHSGSSPMTLGGGIQSGMVLFEG